MPARKKLKPPTALDDRFMAVGLMEGRLFRPIGKRRISEARLTDRSIATIVKPWASAAGLDPALADPFKVMRVAGHKQIETLKVYDRRNEAFRNHAGRISYEPRPTWPARFAYCVEDAYCLRAL